MSSRRHSGRRATEHRHLQHVRAVTGLGGPRGKRGNTKGDHRGNTTRGKGGGNNKYNTGGGNNNKGDEGDAALTSRQQRVRNIMERHRTEITRGVSEGTIAKWAEECYEAQTILAEADPDLLALEEEQITKRLEKYKSPSLGNLSSEKPEGFKRIMAVQLNGTATKFRREVKVDQCTQLINRYDVDVMTYTEHGLNMARFKPSETFCSFFDSEIELRSVTGHNSFENPISQHQQGGTGVLATNEILPYFRSGGTDFRNLGRWTSIVLEGGSHFRTRIVNAYCLGKSRSKRTGRLYQQHLRYLQHHGMDELTNPYDLFCDDLIRQLQTWRRQGDRLILTMDANEHVLRQALGTKLVASETGLDLVEISHRCWGG